ncbi:hypothetical protein [Roseinatronobacter thiooxidans]|nr:hypothetical protein [Roseinatronobacter thiooxidans]
MRKIKDVLRLRAAGYSARSIAGSLRLGRTSARNYLERAEKAGFSWPDVADLDEDALEHRLFGREARPEGHRFVEPDWAEVNQEFKRPGVTLLRKHSPRSRLAVCCCDCLSIVLTNEWS